MKTDAYNESLAVVIAREHAQRAADRIMHVCGANTWEQRFYTTKEAWRVYCRTFDRALEREGVVR